MVLKGRILSGIEDLQQSGGWVAMKTRAELVDFIQHEDGVSAAGLSDSLNNITGQCPDVGTPMTANIRLIVDPAKTLAHELTIHRPSDTLPEGGLSYSRRTDQAQDRALPLRHELANGEKLNDALFYFFKTVVVSVQNLARLRKVNFFFGENAPREFHQPVEVSPDQRVFSRHFRNAFKPV